MRGPRTLAVLLIVALLPLIAPGAWLHAGGFPNVALLVVMYLAFEAGPAPATWCGVLIGFLACPWTLEPLGQSSFLLGSLGFVTGSVRQSFNRELASVQLALVAAGAFALHVVGEGLVGGVGSAVRAVPTALITAGVTAVVAPPVFGLLDRVRLLKQQRRRRRFV
jgi:rod shape-determining protein MreD